MRKSIILTKMEYYIDYTFFMMFQIRAVRKLKVTYKIRVYIDDICSYKRGNTERKSNGAINHSSIRKPYTWIEIVGKGNSCGIVETPEQIEKLIKEAK